MSLAPVKHEPPFYLLTQPLSNFSSQSAASFTHPIVEYHFADDPPSNLLPKSDAETVVVLDYEDSDPTPVVRSLHHDLAVAGVKVTTAPGATAGRDGEIKRNGKMYIIETLGSTVRERSNGGASLGELEGPQLLLAQFRERNALLRRVLDQPTTKASVTLPDPRTKPDESQTL